MQARILCFAALTSIGALVAMAGCQEKTRRDHPVEATVEAASPDADSAWSSFDQHRDLRLFGRDSDMGAVAFEGKAATDLRQHTTPSDGADFDPDVDATGKWLVYASTRHAKNSHLYIKSTSGSTITEVTDGPGNDAQPECDPVGKRIAFASDRSGNWDIWVVGADGRNPIQITSNPMPELHPSWSPDGKRLTYCRINPKEDRGELWIVDLSNPGVKRMIGEGLFPAWSPKGDKIAYQRSRARGSRWFSIWTIVIADDEVLFPTEVASSPSAALIAPTWSPDGSQLAFSWVSPEQHEMPGAGQDRPVFGRGRAQIGIVDVDGRARQRLTDGRGEHYSPTWSHDGRIYFSKRVNDSEMIWSVKPFRPTLFSEPPSSTTTSDRRAAQVAETDLED